MNAVDTNILLYSVDLEVPDKQAVAGELLVQLSSSADAILMWQVATEFLSNLRRWQHADRITASDVDDYFDAVYQVFPLALPTRSVLDRSLDLFARYSLSHWDSLLVAACLESGVTKLYSEDMGHNSDYDGLTVVNPFA